MPKSKSKSKTKATPRKVSAVTIPIPLPAPLPSHINLPVPADVEEHFKRIGTVQATAYGVIASLAIGKILYDKYYVPKAISYPSICRKKYRPDPSPLPAPNLPGPSPEPAPARPPRRTPERALTARQKELINQKFIMPAIGGWQLGTNHHQTPAVVGWNELVSRPAFSVFKNASERSARMYATLGDESG